MFRWGCNHEKQATERYRASAVPQHNELTIVENGFFIDILHSYIGASPDGLVSCLCCDEGVLEVKCPLCVKDHFPADDNEEQGRQKFCMSQSVGSKMRSHLLLSDTDSDVCLQA
jgi:hypothetical protein